jgi:hypothetical protein
VDGSVERTHGVDANLDGIFHWQCYLATRQPVLS